MRIHAISLAALLGGALLGFVYLDEACAQPQPKKPASKPACGAKVLPLVVGNVWTYSWVTAPTQLPEQLARLAPNQPKSIVVTVTNIETKGTDTVVTLEEKVKYELKDPKDPDKPRVVEQTVQSTITCTPKGKFDISPESFFFNGEPGGYHGLVFDKFERKKETSFKLTNGTIGEAEWIEEITSHFTRPTSAGATAKHSGGKLELERKFIPQESEAVATKMQTYPKTEKLGVTTTGRVLLDDRKAPNGKSCTTTKKEKKMLPDPADPTKQTEQEVDVPVPVESCELPANWITQLWMVDDVGVVQVLNSYAHMYQLVDMQLK